MKFCLLFFLSFSVFAQEKLVTKPVTCKDFVNHYLEEANLGSIGAPNNVSKASYQRSEYDNPLFPQVDIEKSTEITDKSGRSKKALDYRVSTSFDLLFNTFTLSKTGQTDFANTDSSTMKRKGTAELKFNFKIVEQKCILEKINYSFEPTAVKNKVSPKSESTSLDFKECQKRADDYRAEIEVFRNSKLPRSEFFKSIYGKICHKNLSYFAGPQPKQQRAHQATESAHLNKVSGE